MLSRLTIEKITQRAKDKNLIIKDAEKYETLKTPLHFECLKCGKEFESTIDTIQNPAFRCPHCEYQTVKYVGAPPEKTGYRVIGCDQATQHFGISVYDNGKLVYFDCIEFTGELEQRYAQIFIFMEQVIQNWEPDWVEIEDIQLQGGTGGYSTFKILAGLFGIMKMVLSKNKVPHEAVLNKTWQAEFMIKGKDRTAQKLSVIEKVKETFGVQVSDDVADAILIGKYGAMRKSRNFNKLF